MYNRHDLIFTSKQMVVMVLLQVIVHKRYVHKTPNITFIIIIIW